MFRTMMSALIACVFTLAGACGGPVRSPEPKGGSAAAGKHSRPAPKPETPIAPRAVTALTGASVFDGTGRATVADAVVLIKKDRIAAVGPRGKVEIPKGAHVIDMAGKWIVPGLIDAHVHFFQSGGIYTRPHIIDLREVRSYELETKALRTRLPDMFRRYLVSGVTAVVDVGGPFWNFEVRRKARATLQAPRVAAAGPLISTIARPKLDIGDPPIIKAETAAHARELVKRQLKEKPDLIKIWFIISPAFSPERGLKQTVDIMRAAVQEAHAAGIRVAVHATDAEAARASVKAGAEILVHSIDNVLMDESLIQQIKEKNVILIPTLQVLEGYVETLEQNPKVSDFERRYGDPQVLQSWRELNEITGPPPPEGNKRRARLEKTSPVMMKNLARLHKAGVTIAAGTDAGNIGTLHGPSIHHELELMAKAGMDARSILLSATRDAAKVFSSKPEIGTLEPGRFADMLVLDGDPLADIANLKRIHRVVKDGAVFSPSQILPSNPEWVVQQQLDAYNARNIDQFLSHFHGEAELLKHPGGEVIAKGKAELRRIYSKLFESSPKLRCRLLSRIVQGNIVTDHELVTGHSRKPYLHGVAIYEVEGELIKRVWFLSP